MSGKPQHTRGSDLTRALLAERETLATLAAERETVT